MWTGQCDISTLFQSNAKNFVYFQLYSYRNALFSRTFNLVIFEGLCLKKYRKIKAQNWLQLCPSYVTEKLLLALM